MLVTPAAVCAGSGGVRPGAGEVACVEPVGGTSPIADAGASTGRSLGRGLGIGAGVGALRADGADCETALCTAAGFAGAGFIFGVADGADVVSDGKICVGGVWALAVTNGANEHMQRPQIRRGSDRKPIVPRPACACTHALIARRPQVFMVRFDGITSGGVKGKRLLWRLDCTKYTDQGRWHLHPIANAIRDNQLYLAYQPQVLADAGTIVAVETLVRWHHPTLGDMHPAQFVPEAETSGEIDLLGAFVLRRACLEAKAWPGLRTAVNVSPRQFGSPNFVRMVLEAIEQAGLPPHNLEIEVTEGTYFEDPDGAVAEMVELRSHGIRIALDDFGTGYASLSTLRSLPLDKIKIDKSFVDAIDRRDGAAIVKAIVDLAHALGLEVTAEGVQTRAQQVFLRDIGCHYLQGYLYSRAVSASELVALIEAQSKGAPALS